MQKPSFLRGLFYTIKLPFFYTTIIKVLQFHTSIMKRPYETFYFYTSTSVFI